jgi:hypothetical protein
LRPNDIERSNEKGRGAQQWRDRIRQYYSKVWKAEQAEWAVGVRNDFEGLFPPEVFKIIVDLAKSVKTPVGQL